MPWRLSKGAKGKGVDVRNATVSLGRGSYMGHHLGLKYVDPGHTRLERAKPTKDLVAVIASHSYGPNFARLLADIKRRGPAYVGTAVGQVYRPLSELRKSRDKIRASLNHLVWLTAGASDLTCDQNVPAVPVYSAKRIARQRSLGTFVPGHHGASI